MIDIINYKKVISYGPDNKVVIGLDDSCIKSAISPKGIERLKKEAECLKQLDGHVAPKLIEYDNSINALKMEYIGGLTITEYVDQFGKIPRFYFARLASNFLEILNDGVEYGGDLKYEKHFIITEDQDVRIIDYGISEILSGSHAINVWRDYYKRQFAFVFPEASQYHIDTSIETISKSLELCCIPKDVIERYFKDYDKIS